jgi:hypothetical protein
MPARLFLLATFALSILRAQSGPKDLYTNGRDAMDRQNWVSAESYFTEHRRLYPKASNADAVDYYLAFCLKRQGRSQEAAAMAGVLIREFPDSGWAEDARTIQLELADRTGDYPAIERGLRDGDDRGRSAALETLLRIKPEEARRQIAAILAPSTTASERLQGFCLVLLAQQGRANLPALFDAAEHSSSEQVRAFALNLLSRLSLPEARRFLEDFALHQDGRVAEMALVSLQRAASPPTLDFLRNVRLHARSLRARAVAVTFIGLSRQNGALSDLAAAWESAPEPLIREHALDAMWRMKTPQAADHLKGAARAASLPPELKGAAAYYALANEPAKASEALGEWFRFERDEEVRMVVLWLLSRQNTPSAQQEIKRAESDSSARVRAQAKALLHGGDIKLPLILGQDPLPLPSQHIF